MVLRCQIGVVVLSRIKKLRTSQLLETELKSPILSTMQSVRFKAVSRVDDGRDE